MKSNNLFLLTTCSFLIFFSFRYENLHAKNVSNKPPVVQNIKVSTSENTAMSISLTASDQDNDILTCHIKTQPKHGSLSGVLPNLIYTPEKNYTGSDSFTYYFDDNTNSSKIATITITVFQNNNTHIAEDNETTNENKNNSEKSEKPVKKPFRNFFISVLGGTLIPFKADVYTLDAFGGASLDATFSIGSGPRGTAMCFCLDIFGGKPYAKSGTGSDVEIDATDIIIMTKFNTNYYFTFADNNTLKKSFMLYAGIGGAFEIVKGTIKTDYGSIDIDEKFNSFMCDVGLRLNYGYFSIKLELDIFTKSENTTAALQIMAGFCF